MSSLTDLNDMTLGIDIFLCMNIHCFIMVLRYYWRISEMDAITAGKIG